MEEVKHRIQITRTQKPRISQVDFGNLPFGKIFSDHMLVAQYKGGEWRDAEILPYGKIEMEPCITAIHYGICVFEGMKAYKNIQGDPVLFRPRDNHLRLNRSAARLVMPAVPQDIFIEGLKELVGLDRDWIPREKGGALYIRPVLFATDEYIGAKPAEDFKLIILTCPVGAYYLEPVNLWVTEEYVRAIEGGTGEAKAAGNYAASLLGVKQAQEQGYHNVLWLDGKEHRYIEECGTMNIFFVIDGTVLTPPLGGTILPGITRDSVLTLLRDEGTPLEERRISIEEVAEAHQAGKLQECFGSGTAATITHVAKIGYRGKDWVLPPIEEREIGSRLLRKLDDIRLGKAEDPHDWVVKV